MQPARYLCRCFECRSLRPIPSNAVLYGSQSTRLKKHITCGSVAVYHPASTTDGDSRTGNPRTDSHHYNPCCWLSCDPGHYGWPCELGRSIRAGSADELVLCSHFTCVPCGLMETDVQLARQRPRGSLRCSKSISDPANAAGLFRDRSFAQLREESQNH